MEQHYAITTERHLPHPAVVEISKSARDVVFTNQKQTLSG